MQKSAPHGEYSDKPQYPIESVDNALQVILMFADRRTVRLTDVSKELGVAQSTAHRLAAMLTYRGFIRREVDSKLFVPGPALLDVGLNVVRSLDIRGAARPVMEELSAKLGETVHLVVREGAEVRFLDAVESERALRVSGRTGMLLPVHATSVGKALIAELDPEELRAILPPGRLKAVTKDSITNRKELEQELARVRELGYAHNNGESETGVGSVGMVIHQGGLPVYALSIAAPLTRLDATLEQRAVAGLYDAVQRVERRLG